VENRSCRPSLFAASPSAFKKALKMNAVFGFVITLLVALWAVDKLAFDSVYTTNIWKQANAYGQEWENEAKHWFRQRRV